ncbi:hypothetical protein Taro_048391 [Colocasia esculenta]|uniref:Stigma-specific STIG1-like protein 1 n=1 Tax=Colocasia esculenta TaxID=4460 RepID=A0A843X7U6_COLES|nr:hypothetical protein [Colocasia esculenta]
MRTSSAPISLFSCSITTKFSNAAIFFFSSSSYNSVGYKSSPSQAMKLISGVFFVFVVAFLLSLVSSSVHGEAPWSLGRRSRTLLAEQNHRPVPRTCNHFPRICSAEGSPGPSCCKKQCVNVMIDSRNCGQCGNKCRYGEACCSGNCVNIMYARNNCGGCHERCKNGSYCTYGMCSYG